LGRLWEAQHAQHRSPLADVLGHTRATLLRQLDLPMTTTQLATLLSLTAPTLNVHLKSLQGAGLVSSRRDGRSVLYVRTDLDERLLAGNPGHKQPLSVKASGGYFAGRAAPLGRVPAEVVHAIFYNFADGEVCRHIPRVWDTATPEEPVARLWHAATLLREHRGDGHIAALVTEGIGGTQAHVLHALSGGIPAEKFGRVRHLPAVRLAAVVDGMRARGLIGAWGGWDGTRWSCSRGSAMITGSWV
jgi:DNA-binding transcriptional ArsR family regulator